MRFQDRAPRIDGHCGVPQANRIKFAIPFPDGTGQEVIQRAFRQLQWRHPAGPRPARHDGAVYIDDIRQFAGGGRGNDGRVVGLLREGFQDHLVIRLRLVKSGNEINKHLVLCRPGATVIPHAEFGLRARQRRRNQQRCEQQQQQFCFHLDSPYLFEMWSDSPAYRTSCAHASHASRNVASRRCPKSRSGRLV